MGPDELFDAHALVTRANIMRIDIVGYCLRAHKDFVGYCMSGTMPFAQ
jgi:hypothetical protein